ncbi:hypothetical protein [Streptomyces sp. SJL17-4]|uniref:hypothetical protein n=1 Tax=Streptomyces sp. SJL17-4 TaxID=2967224 RepID=UPI0030CFBB41
MYTPTGMPIMWALANPKIGEREVLAAMLEVDARPVANREGILLISDKGFASKPFEKALAEQGIEQRVLAMAAAIWHNNKTSASIPRSLIADRLRSLITSEPLL